MYCDKCKIELRTEAELIRHYKRKYHRGETPCKQCGKPFRGRDDMRAHMIAEHSVKCETCSQNFVSLNDFKRHEAGWFGNYFVSTPISCFGF